ncbi:hypothetical protein ES708_16388 [subsurface metagenome]
MSSALNCFIVSLSIILPEFGISAYEYLVEIIIEFEKANTILQNIIILPFPWSFVMVFDFIFRIS